MPRLLVLKPIFITSLVLVRFLLLNKLMLLLVLSELYTVQFGSMLNLIPLLIVVGLLTLPPTVHSWRISLPLINPRVSLSVSMDPSINGNPSLVLQAAVLTSLSSQSGMLTTIRVPHSPIGKKTSLNNLITLLRVYLCLMWI